MPIQNFVFDKAQGTLQWTAAGKRVQVAAAGFEQAQADATNDCVLALEATATLPSRLHVFASSGAVLATLGAPQGFQFYYLTPYPQLGVAVVCVTSQPVEGFRDWHFGVDLKQGTLFRHAPAY